MEKLCEEINHLEDVSVQTKRGLINRLRPIMLTFGKGAGQSRKRLCVEKLKGRYIAMELDGLEYSVQNFVVGYFLASLFAYQIAAKGARLNG